MIYKHSKYILTEPYLTILIITPLHSNLYYILLQYEPKNIYLITNYY